MNTNKTNAENQYQADVFQIHNFKLRNFAPTYFGMLLH